VQQLGSAREPAPVIIRARRSGTVVGAVLTFIWALALVTSVGAQPTTSGKVTAGIFFGLLIVASVGGWLAVNRRRSQLAVGPDLITYRSGTKAPVTLSRAHGESLRILPRLREFSVVGPERLLLLGSGGAVSLASMSSGQVRHACEAQGWRFDGGSDLAVSDVRRWLHAGRPAEAAQLIELFGPFTEATADEEADTSLVAAVLEDCGDRVLRRNRASARGAYRRAAAAQRAFAGHASSADAGAARDAQASRLDAKARG
jgi:hypothetical protein